MNTINSKLPKVHELFTESIAFRITYSWF